MEESHLLAVILVTSGSRGNRLLFRYPVESDATNPRLSISPAPVKNPYAVRIAEDIPVNKPIQVEGESPLSCYNDHVLANLLAVKKDLCEKTFEVKINDILFLGHPILLHSGAQDVIKPRSGQSTMSSFSIVFVLKASAADDTMITCYQSLSKQLAVALRHEEKRAGYLETQKNTMVSVQEEVATATEDSMESPYNVMVRKSVLCNQLKTVYENLCTTGVVQFYINKWIYINFCLPHKVHSQYLPQHAATDPEVVRQAISSVRPYHGMLLLEDVETLVSHLPPDASPGLLRVIRQTSHVKSLTNLAADADLALGQVFQIVGHLVYWGKAIIIYPLCESNVYVLAPNSSTYVNSLVEGFTEHFPRMSLPAVLAEFSLPSPLGEHRDVLGMPPQHRQQVQMVVWLLRQRLLVQLHTYIFILPGLRQPRNVGFVADLVRRTSDMKASRPRHSQQLSPLVEDPPSPRSPLGQSSVTDKESGTSDLDSPTHSTTIVPSSASESMTEPSSSQEHWNIVNVQEHWRQRDSHLAHLNAEQKKAIQAVPAANNPEDLKLFTRLCPYFTGRHHLEEIMYYENVRRSQLLTLLDKFRTVLITTQHEDPALCCWIKTNKT